jgi:hypothetical protein
MSHAYRVFRQSKIPTLRSRAKNDMQICCGLLHKMRVHWWSAGTMADLGRAALKKAASGRDEGGAGSQTVVKETEKDLNTLVEPLPTATLSSIDMPTTTGTDLTSTTPLPTPSTSSGNDLTTTMGLDPSISPDWLNFDTAFENFDALLGSSGPDVSMELLKPFNFDEFASYTF